jgi:hypothetical protein
LTGEEQTSINVAWKQLPLQGYSSVWRMQHQQTHKPVYPAFYIKLCVLSFWPAAVCNDCRSKAQADASAAAPCLLSSPVLPVLLQHPCIQHCSTACILLCTAKAFEQPITQYMRGQLDVQCNMQQQGASSCQLRGDFLDWLAQYGCLAKTLKLQLYPAYQPTCSSMAAFAAALKLAAKQQSACRTAAAAGGSRGSGLALQAFEAPASSVAVLQALPAASLTRLDPGQLVYAELDDKITAPRKALQRLTSLQELTLHKGDASVLLQATSKLLQLRSLNAKQLSAAGIGAFKHLPPQLQSCTFTADLSGAASGLSADEVGAGKQVSPQQLN